MTSEMRDGLGMIVRKHQRDGQCDVVKRIYLPARVQCSIRPNVILDISEGSDDLINAVWRLQLCGHNSAGVYRFCHSVVLCYLVWVVTSRSSATADIIPAAFVET